MVSIHDVLAHIAEVSTPYAPNKLESQQDEYWQHYPYRLRIAITSDIEATELEYLNKYGQNETIYFSLRDYDHGCELAKELFRTVSSAEPDMIPFQDAGFGVFDKLYLFIYVEIVDHNEPGSGI